MKYLITGGNGFVGVHLAKFLAQSHDEVIISGTEKDSNTSHNNIEYIQLDITDRDSVLNHFKNNTYDGVFHLAAISSVSQANRIAIEDVFNVNTLGTINILDALKGSDTRFLFASTSEVYSGDAPFSEESKTIPSSVYGLSKLHAEKVCLSYNKLGLVDTICARPFSHTGAGQSPKFAFSSFAKQIAEISTKNKEPVLNVGNLSVKRDYTDVNDIVRGYKLLMDNGRRGEIYNLCCGKSYLLSDLLDVMINLSKDDIKLNVESNRLRPGEQTEVYGSYDKINSELGWSPTIKIEETLRNLFNYWSHSGVSS